MLLPSLPISSTFEGSPLGARNSAARACWRGLGPFWCLPWNSCACACVDPAVLLRPAADLGVMGTHDPVTLGAEEGLV